MSRTDDNKEIAPQDEQSSREVEFSVIDGDFTCGQLPNATNTGTLIDLDNTGIGLTTNIPLQPGNIVKFDQGGMSKLGIVMWSVESSDKSSDNFRIQVRFL
jgi:hypothetical protein